MHTPVEKSPKMPVQKTYYKGQIVSKEPSCVLAAVMLMAKPSYCIYAMPRCRCEMAPLVESVAHTWTVEPPPVGSGLGKASK